MFFFEFVCNFESDQKLLQFNVDIVLNRKCINVYVNFIENRSSYREVNTNLCLRSVCGMHMFTIDFKHVKVIWGSFGVVSKLAHRPIHWP